MAAYVYKITFDEVPHFYFGVRGRDPDGDPYLGSPKTHRCYWETYTPKKQIFSVYNSWERACEIEKELIRQNWKNRYCLNESCGGFFSPQANSKGGRIGGRKGAKKLQERRANDPELAARCREASARGAKKFHERRANDPEFDARFREAVAKNRKKANSQRWQCTVTGYISTPGPLARYQKKRGIDPKNRIQLT
jgi:hypothetical protein